MAVHRALTEHLTTAARWSEGAAFEPRAVWIAALAVAAPVLAGWASGRPDVGFTIGLGAMLLAGESPAAAAPAERPSPGSAVLPALLAGGVGEPDRRLAGGGPLHDRSGWSGGRGQRLQPACRRGRDPLHRLSRPERHPSGERRPASWRRRADLRPRRALECGRPRDALRQEACARGARAAADPGAAKRLLQAKPAGPRRLAVPRTPGDRSGRRELAAPPLPRPSLHVDRADCGAADPAPARAHAGQDHPTVGGDAARRAVHMADRADAADGVAAGAGDLRPRHGGAPGQGAKLSRLRGPIDARDPAGHGPGQADRGRPPGRPAGGDPHRVRDRDRPERGDGPGGQPRARGSKHAKTA